MKNFESFLAKQLQQYVRYRQNLGYAEERIRYALFVLDKYLQQQNATWDLMQPLFFLEMREKINKNPQTVNKILCALRGFFQFLVRQHYCSENPLQDVPPLPQRYFIPFVFCPIETEQLLEAFCKKIRKNEKYFLTDMAEYLSILLLARCGLRISEPIRLLRHHYRHDDGTIYIEKTKFRKDRLIPVPKCAMIQIENYLQVRKTLLLDDQNPYLLAGKEKKPFTDEKLRRLFHKAVKDIGLNRPKQTIGDMIFGSPTPHSLRHAFAINTLKRIRERGKSPQHALPVLAAYMGHRKYHYTAAYLKVSDAKHLEGLINFAKSQLDLI
jgi:integrase